MHYVGLAVLHISDFAVNLSQLLRQSFISLLCRRCNKPQYSYCLSVCPSVNPKTKRCSRRISICAVV